MKPSNIYWNGLRTVGIIRYPSASLDSVCRQIAAKTNNRSEISLKTSDRDVEQDDMDALRSGSVIFTPIVPTYDVLKEATVALTYEEAEYLKRMFTTSPATKNSLMAHMLLEGQVYPSVFDVPANCLKEPLKNQFELAREFAEFIYGAHLLYNIILSDGCGVENEKSITVKEEFEQWADNYQSAQLENIIAVTKCPLITAKFFREFDEAISEKDIERAKEIILARERLVKPGRQKLRRPDYFSYKDPIHWYKLNYRYNTAKTIAEDILTALKEGN
jgi:hypothetical protein